jgi:hypothetical protein
LEIKNREKKHKGGKTKGGKIYYLQRRKNKTISLFLNRNCRDQKAMVLLKMLK